MPLLNRFWPYSDSWYVAVNSDVKHAVHGMDVHSVGVHDLGVGMVRFLGVGSVGKYGT
jgi:hypothetical protein